MARAATLEQGGPPAALDARARAAHSAELAARAAAAGRSPACPWQRDARARRRGTTGAGGRPATRRGRHREHRRAVVGQPALCRRQPGDDSSTKPPTPGPQRAPGPQRCRANATAPGRRRCRQPCARSGRVHRSAHATAAAADPQCRGQPGRARHRVSRPLAGRHTAAGSASGPGRRNTGRRGRRRLGRRRRAGHTGQLARGRRATPAAGRAPARRAARARAAAAIELCVASASRRQRLPRAGLRGRRSAGARRPVHACRRALVWRHPRRQLRAARACGRRRRHRRPRHPGTI